MASLIYIADPLCSWCYGFGPQLKALLAGLPEVSLDIVVGGLRAYNTEPMDDTLRDSLLQHWHHVAVETGLPFDYDAPSRPGFIYDTEPACRAVVTARQFAPAATLDVFHAIQHAFYAQGKETTDGTTLAEIACAALHQAGTEISVTQFQTSWADDATIAATRDEFTQTQRWGISGFPTLVLERDGKLDLISAGFARTEVLVERMQALVDSATA